MSRPAYIWNNSTRQADLLGGVSAALAAASLVFADDNATYAAALLATAKQLWAWGVNSEGAYSNYHTSVTSIYPSSDWKDDMAWGAGWLFKATGDASYLTAAHSYWARGGMDVYTCWDSVGGPTAVLMHALAAGGASVPGIDDYTSFLTWSYTRSWLQPDGTWSIVATPKGMAYPSWSQWGNLALSSHAAMTLLVHAKHNTDAAQRQQEVAFARTQVDYILGSTGRSFVVGWGRDPPQFAHHAGASCPDMPAPCDWAAFSSASPNPQVIRGALVAGPGGVAMNSSDPDASYYDKRDDYVTNEVAVSYNGGLAGALAGLCQLL
jgi:hypothetical protein